MEAASVADVSRGQAAGQVGDFVGEGVPGAGVLFRGRVGRRGDEVTLFDEGVEVDHLEVVVEEVEDGIAGDAWG